jgi:hypothetical protein
MERIKIIVLYMLEIVPMRKSIWLERITWPNTMKTARLYNFGLYYLIWSFFVSIYKTAYIKKSSVGSDNIIYNNNQSFNTMNGSHHMYISYLARENKILLVAFCCCCINKTAKLDNPWNFAFVQTGRWIQFQKKGFIICLKENIYELLLSHLTA